jgi:hypothetical protein
MEYRRSVSLEKGQGKGNSEMPLINGGYEDR